MDMNKLPPELTTVTPISKALALMLFVALPFVGFIIGWQYGVSTTPTEPVGFEYTPPQNEPDEQLPEAPGTDPLVRGEDGTNEVPDPVDTVEPVPPQDDLEPFVPPVLPEENTTCGVTNCHGMEVTCGDVSEGGLMCTMEYRIDDFCRRYVSCETVNGICEAVKDPRHETCVSCVNECLDMEDPMNAFDCGETCRTTLE